MNLETFSTWLDFLAASGIHEIRLIGGEPTLHPQLADLLQLASQRRQRILIFTHGWLRPAVLKVLDAMPGTDLHLMVNMNAQPPLASRRQGAADSRDPILQRLPGAGPV